MIKSLGGEPFSTGFPEKLWGIFDREYEESITGEFVSANRRTVIQCRETDVELHGVVKNHVLKRDRDGKSYAVADLEHDGTGMTLLVLSA